MSLEYAHFSGAYRSYSATERGCSCPPPGEESPGRVFLSLAVRRCKKIAIKATFTGALACMLLLAVSVCGQEELTRKVKTRVAPVYPALARRSNVNISGTVKVRVVVAPDGSVKELNVVGGHPLLVNAAMDALKKWKFEPASEESSGTVIFNFKP